MPFLLARFGTQDRIKLCYLLNVAMCLAQAAACFFTVFRWLHVNNVQLG